MYTRLSARRLTFSDLCQHKLAQTSNKWYNPDQIVLLSYLFSYHIRMLSNSNLGRMLIEQMWTGCFSNSEWKRITK
jgi:hypothetical protein